MSALPIDLPLVEIPASGRRRWTHVAPAPRPARLRPAAVPQARPAALRTPGGRPRGVAAPQVRPRPVSHPGAVGDGALRLTRRGLAVVVGGFTALMVTAFVVLVTAFLAVSNEPIVSQLPLG